MEVNLSATDLLLAAHYAGLVEGVKSVQVRQRQVANRRICGQSDFTIHYIGMLGEIAVGKVLGLPVNAQITVGGDGAIDMQMHGQTIQVKTSSYAKTPQPRLLIFNSERDFATDWAISCSVQSPTVVKIHGFVGKDKFRRLAITHDFGFGQRVCLDEKHLTGIDKFGEAVEWKRSALAA